MTRRVGLLLVVCCAATLLGVRAVSVSEDEFPTAYSLPMMSEPVVSASTPPGAAPVPMSLAEEQNAMAAAEAAERRRLTAEQFAQTVQERLQPHTSASHPRVVLGAGKRSYSAGFTAPADPLASIFGSPMRPRAPAPPAPSASRPRGVPPKMAAAPTAPATSLLETRAHAQTAEDDEEEGGGELSGSRQVELGGDMTNAYNLYEQRVPVEPTPLSPSPFVEHPAPKQNLYPYEHTRAQLTVSPDTGTLEPNAGDGVQATTMPYQYRPYIKNEKLHRGVDPLVYRSMYTWTPNDSAGPGDVSVQDAIKEPRDMFKPRDWSVKITQPAANIEIARRGQDNYGADHRSQIAVPTMPPEFYQFSAPTPPMFHAPLPPVPRKAHRDAAPRAPDIFPAFIEEATSVTAAEQQQVVSESAASEEQRDAGAYDINLPPGSKFKPFPLVRPHIHPTGSIRRYRIASDPLQELLNDPYWDALERENDQALNRHRAAAPSSAVAQVKDLKRKRAEVVAPKPVQPQPQVTPVVSKPAVTQPAAPKVSLPTVAAPVPQSHDAMVREFERLANRHSAIVSVRDAADAAAGQRWHALNRKHQRQPLTRYEELQAAHDRLPHERYHELHRRLARHPYERYDALHDEYQSQFGGGGGSTATAPYERYGQLHQQLYGVPPPPPQGLAQEQPRFQQTEVADSVEEVEGVEEAEAEAAQDGFSTGAPADSFFAPDQFDAETGVQYDRETAAVQTPQQTEGDSEAHQHLALFYPSIRAAAGVQA